MFKSLFTHPIRTPRVAVRAAATLSIAALVSGCDFDPHVITIPAVGRKFTATLIGGSAGIYLGGTHGVVAAGTFTLVLTTDDGQFSLAISRVGNRPLPGSYALGIDPHTGFAAILTVGNIVYGNANGTLTITTSTPSEITGTFSFTSPPTSGGAIATSVNGSFTSSCAGDCLP
jgi:hypothetical protein